MRKRSTNKNGISLIFLVITIIVMIIITGAVIVSLSSGNITNKAKDAVEKINLKSLQDAATLAYTDYKLNGKTGNISEYIKNWLITKKYASEKDIGKYIFDESGKVLSRYSLQEVNLSGTNISQNKTYNDSAFLRIYGKSKQIGIPSPDTPSPINSVSDFDLIISGKNLFIDELMLDTNNYEFISPYHYYEISGLKANTNYTFGLKNDFKLDSINRPSVGNRAIRINNTKTNPSGINVVNVTPTEAVSTPRTIKSNEDGILYLVVYQPQILDFLSHGLQLEEGTSQTIYEPFKGNIINFPYTLRSLPNGTKDYIEIDNVSKTAKLYRNVGTTTFDGSYTYYVYTYGNSHDTYTYHCYNRMSSNLPLLRGDAISTRFEKTGSIRMNSVDENIITTYYVGGVKNTVYFQLSKTLIDSYSGATTADKIKTFFTTNPTEFHYQLATTTVTNLSYNEVNTYYPYTQIYTNSTVQPTLEAKMVTSN
ncbi:MAG: hypothetical protein PHR25_01155 [Clostridia bacterium]|nr:hypothetical protein [Clostridia bacterium]MDD4375375.1 hypothetical protein [Clostridia bacterium]